MTDTRSRLIACFSVVFPELSVDEIPHASVASVGNWDSLAAVTLQAVVEEEFGIELAQEDLEQFVSFDLLLDYLTSQQSQNVT